MKKIYTLSAAVLCSLQVMSQPWLENVNVEQMTVAEIAEAYEARPSLNHSVDEEKGTTDNEDEREDNNYHFRRWLNFVEGRTDEQGHLVSTAHIWRELKKLQAKEGINRAEGKSTAMDANWTFHGPTNPLSGNFGLGRLTVVEFHPTDSNVYIIGTPGGGIWRTKDDGATWAPLNDFFPVLGVADIDYNPQNPNTIYVCTGDRDAGDTYSMGIFKSTDGGATWDTTGFQYPFTASKKTNGLIVNPIDTNSLTVATSDGIYKSYDAGKSWTLLYTGYFQQLLPHPTDTAIMFAAGSYQGAQNVFRSNDGGTSWQVVSGVNNGRRVEIAVTKANTAVVKVVVAKSDYGLEGIYNSTDTGKTFTKIFDDGTNCSTNILASSPKGDECAGQGWYDLSIEISPLDENQVVVGGVNTWVSTNGGSSWKLVNQWKNTVTGVTIVHADKHFHKFHPLQPSTLFECNDGGLFKTYAPMSTNSIWDNKSEGLGITQFYRNAVSDAATYVLGGAQDNGTKMLVGGTSQQMTGADGMECQMDPVDSNILYTAQQYGELRRSVDGGQKFTDIQGNIPGKPKGAWITPYIIHPVGRNVLVAGYNYVFVSTDYGDNWSAISPNFFNNITQLAATAIDDKYLFCATVTSSASTIRYTTDFGNAWKVLSPINSNMLTVSGLMVDPFCKDSLWVTYRTYTADKVAVADIRTGKWTVVDNGLPDVPVNCIEYDKSNNTLYIGTDLGVFYKEYNDTAWQYFNNGTLPNVEVMDLGINNTTNTIWAATYGRGMWSSPTHKSTTGIANTIPLAQDVVTIAPNPNYGDFNISTKNLALKGKSTAIRIMNMAGIVVWRNDVVLSKDGGAKIKVDLPRGTYLVEVLHEGTIFAKTKMVVF